jgi:RHS repeat-associated protein
MWQLRESGVLGHFVSTTEYTGFDILGRVTASKQTTDGVTYGNGSTDSAMTYTYNLGGAMIEQQYPSGRVVKNTVDATGDLAMVQSKENSSTIYKTYANDFTYTAAGAVGSLKLGNGRFESTTFNSRLQPTQIGLGTSESSQNILKLEYDYGTNANNGNIQSQTITVPGMSHSLFQNYTYDSLNRLESAIETSNSEQTWKQEFSYDRYGNRNFVTGTGHTTTLGSCTTMCNPTFDATNNRITSTGFSYDSSGNTTRDAGDRKFTYDAENKQTKAETLSAGTNTVTGTIGEYSYDGDGRRVKKYVPSTGETTIFVYDAAGRQIAEYSTIVADSTDAKVAYLTADHLGSPRVNTDVTGAVTSRHDYHPFGEEIYTSQRTTGLGYAADTVRKQFTGYERDDETNLDFARARLHSYTLGRFTSPDDFLNDTAAIEPSSWNLYVYVRNNSTNFVDPDGERVYVGKLSAPDKADVLKRMNSTYGCKECVSVDDDGYLQVDTSSLRDAMLKATKKLTDALNSMTWFAEVRISNNDPNVAFGQGRQSRGLVPMGGGKNRNADLIVLDLEDDKWVSGDDGAKSAFLDTVLAHEILHFTVDPGKLTKDPIDSPNKTGLVVDAVNEILHASSRPLREKYSSVGRGGYWVSLHHGAADGEKRNSDGGIQVKVSNSNTKTINWLKRNVGGLGIN